MIISFDINTQTHPGGSIKLISIQFEVIYAIFSPWNWHVLVHLL